MPKFKFTGDGRNDPEAVELFGITFPINKGVTVEDPAVIAKLEGNSHFAEVKRGRPANDQNDA